MEELGELLGVKRKPAVFKCVIGISETKVGFLISSEPSLTEIDLFDGCYLDDNITEKKSIPTEPGVYKCDVEVNSFRCGHIEDPEEWDMTVILKNIEKINL